MGMRWMAGTSPGVFCCVCLRCVRIVFIRFRLTVGFRACMMAGLLVTLLSSLSSGLGAGDWMLVTLCSTMMDGEDINASRCVQSNLRRAFPFVVPVATVVLECNSSVSAFRCSSRLRFGTWQCCGKSSADPDTRYALVLGK